MEYKSSEKENRAGAWWWDPPEECLPFEFCQDTSLHGLKYIHQPRRHLTERVFWFLAFLIGLIIAIMLITNLWQSFRDKPIIVSFAPFETNVDDIPFPAITICNMNKLQKTKANEMIAKLNKTYGKPEFMDAFEEVEMLQRVCGTSSGFSKTFNFSLHQGSVDEEILNNFKPAKTKQTLSVNQFLRKASQRCSFMIPLCIWQNEVVICKDLFNPIETDFGKCCTFNMVPQTLLNHYQNDSRDTKEEVAGWARWDVEREGFLIEKDYDEHGNFRKFPRRQRRAGKTHGLSILLDPDLDEYYCTTSDSVGFRMAVHLSIDVPSVGELGTVIPPNQEVFVSVKPELTIAEDTIHSFSLDKRLCYFPNDYNLKFYKYYTPSNCVKELMADETLKSCGCVQYYMPRDNVTELCRRHQVKCADEIAKKYFSRLINNGTNCYPLCTGIDYKTELTSTFLENKHDNWQFPNGSFARWRHHNVSILHVFMGESGTYARIRKQFVTPVDLISQTGGIMGLCLGFSGLSLIELIYYFTIRPWLQTKWHANFRARVFQTVTGAWNKNKHIVDVGDSNSWRKHRPPGVVPNIAEVAGGLNRGQRHGIRNQRELIQEINSLFFREGQPNGGKAALSPFRDTFNKKSGVPRDIVQFLEDSHRQEQYWNINKKPV